MKKLLTYAVVIATIVWSMGLGALIPAASAAYTPVANDIVKVSNSSTGSSAVYIIKPDLKPYVFSTRNTYGSWFDNFNTLKYITQAEFDAMTLGGNVTVRPGNLIKFDNGASVYAVVPGNKLCKLPTADADAKALYGANYAARVLLIQVSFVGNYTVDAACAMTATSKLPDGTLIQYVSSSDIYYIENGLKRLVTNEAFLANGFKTANIVTGVATTVTYDTGTSITGLEAGLTTVTVTGAAVVITGGNLTASLSASNPGATTVPTGAEVDLLKVNLAGGSKDTNVTGLVVKRNGMSPAGAIAELGVYVGTTRYGSLKTTWNSSDNTMTFNFPTPITVTAGNTVTITIRGKIGSTGSYAGVLINSAADVITNGTVAGSFPLNGNLMAIAGGVSSASTTLTNPANNDISVNFGDSDVLLAGFDLEVSNAEDVLLNGMTFINGGDAVSTAVNNLRLYVDGTQVGTAEMVGDTVTFTFDSVTINKGDTAQVELKGDMVNGEEGTKLEFYVDKIAGVGKDLGFSMGTNIALLDRKTDAGVSTIILGSGDVTLFFNKSATGGTPAKDVRPDTNNVVLGTLEITSNDENVTIYGITNVDVTAPFQLTGNGLATGEITNVRLQDLNGGTYDVTATFHTDHYDLEMAEEIYLTKGVKKTFSVLADLEPTLSEGDTIRVELDADAIDHEGETSGSTSLTFTPNTVNSSIATVKKSSLTITNVALTNETVVPGASAVLVYQGKLKAGDSSALSVKSIKISGYDLAGNNDDTLFSDANISQLRLYVNGVLVKTKSSAIAEAAVSTTVGSITFDGLNVAVPAGTEYTVKLEADFNSTLSGNGDFALDIASVDDVIVRDVDNNLLVAAQKNGGVALTQLESRQVTLKTVGTLKVDMATTSADWNKDLYLLAGNGLPTGRSLAELKLVAANEAINVTKITLFEGGSATEASIDKIELVDAAGAVVASATFVNGTTTIDMNYTVAKDSTQKLYVRVKAKGINVAGDSASTAVVGDVVAFRITGVEAKGSDTDTDLTMTAGTGLTDNTYDAGGVTMSARVMASVLTSIVSDSSGVGSLVLSGGLSQEIGRYSIVFDNASNRFTDNTDYTAGLETLLLTIAPSANVTVTNIQAYIDGDPSNKTDAVNASGTIATIDLTTIEGDTRFIDGAAKIVIVADIALTGSDAENLQTKIANLSTDFTWANDTTTNNGNSLLKTTEVIGFKLSK